VDEERLFVLDTTVRQDVPGTDGWRGDREWFREELAEAPPFDPTGYVVAVDDRTGGYVGLCRMWRNREGPRLGLIGVLRRYRATTIASALLRQTLIGAAGWGWETFTTEASVSNRHTHPRLVRIAAERTGRSLQMIHP
jgi:GNAT superfamily N-acetyltransferase